MSVHGVSSARRGRGRPLTRPPDAVLLELHEAGASYHELAARFDRLPVVVQNACRRARKAREDR
jgi:hypothetical protein